MSTSASSPKQSPSSEMANIVSGEKKDALLGEFRDQVSKRAYELFEQLGRIDGNDLSHWLRAENDLCVKIAGVQQSGAWYTVSAPVVGVPADHIKVSVEDGGALISAEKSSDGSESREGREYTSVYYSVRFPESVNPETASAYLKNGTLTIVARKAGAPEAVGEPLATQPFGKQRSNAKRGKR
jgi:HSP20 family molecular chaperone IbpA